VFFHDPNISLKYARIEEERRFLLKSVPEELRGVDEFIRIIDGYIPGTRLRLRRMVSPHGNTLALKLGQKYRPVDFEAHQTIMTNLYLNETEYGVLKTLGGSLIYKRRYPYGYQGQKYVVDVFEGKLAGLILAEIEGRPGVDLANLFIPGFALREVTGDPFFSGANLVELSEVEFQAWLTADDLT
jgi:CYTH domain-containing protein